MIDKKQIESIAKLARLKISEQEAEEYAIQLSKALQYFEQIASIQTKNVLPLITPVEIEGHWREDHPLKEITTEELLKEAPNKTGNLFTVPPVI